MDDSDEDLWGPLDDDDDDLRPNVRPLGAVIPPNAPAPPMPPAPPAATTDGGRPTAAADWAVKLVDLKGVARPPPFSGKAVDWADFRFKFAAVADLLGLG
eukprot:1141302-Heterocapsa_arctica.AAC.1